MPTLFTLPKPFTGDTGRIQETALASWRALGDHVQVVLVGDEPGIADAARTVGAEHVGEVARSASGTPRLDDAFARVDEIARHELRLFVNADIVLLPDVLDAVAQVTPLGTFLLVGQTRELAVDIAEVARAEALRDRALRAGRLRGAAAIDWFAFPAGLFDPLPPFLVGRAAFDNWLIWRARRLGPVVDATDAVVAIHQPHGYAHLSGGLREAYYGAEAQENLRLAGGKRHVFTLNDASHHLASGKLRRNLGSILRARETARRVGYKLGRRP